MNTVWFFLFYTSLLWKYSKSILCGIWYQVLVLGLEWTGGRSLCDTAMAMGLGEEAAGSRDSSC